jgi:LytS/YehU family sensor histidine kinase
MSKISTSSQVFPRVQTYTNILSYVLTVVFVALSVAVPWVFHQFHLAGPTFLPMHIFVLVGGLLFGWRLGLIVGLFTPLASYAVSAMPALPILPQVVVELAAYGFAAGFFRERLRLPVIWSLVGAMLAGRLALTLTVFVIYLTTGSVSSPLGAEAGPMAAVWATVKQGWPGIAIQLLSIPAIIWLVGKLTIRFGLREHD